MALFDNSGFLGMPRICPRRIPISIDYLLLHRQQDPIAQYYLSQCLIDLFMQYTDPLTCIYVETKDSFYTDDRHFLILLIFLSCI